MTGMPNPLAIASERPASILIIDDEPKVLSVLQSLLSNEHNCRSASSAYEAIECLKEQSFDLVLSDIMMPGMSGLELLEHIHRSCRDTVVIMISGNLNIQSAIE